MDLDGWHPDPYGIHEERLIADGQPTPLVRDNGIGSLDPPRDNLGRSRTTSILTVAAVLIGAGVIVAILGLTGVGQGERSAATTTTTMNPLVRILLHLPPVVITIPPQRAAPAPPTSTNLIPIERALEALPRSTTAVTTAPTASSTVSRISPTTTRSAAAGVTQPKRTAPSPTVSLVPTTALPLTTTTTSVGEADATWYLAYGSVFNTLQTDIEKLARALESTSPDPYPSVHPYWQELNIDANYALLLPPIPDEATQLEWRTALGDLNEGAMESINGTAGAPGTAGFVPAAFDQGSAFITTGTTQLDNALNSVEQLAGATSSSARNQVLAWSNAHGTISSTLQTDLDKLNAAFPSTTSSDDPSADPYWQQLLSDAQNAMRSTPIPDAVIQSYWSTALGDLVDGASDCLGSSEALPPNLFDQGVASVDTGGSYLGTALAAIQALIG